MLRVLLTASTFPLRPDDGLPRFVYDLAAALARHCRVTALVPDAPGAARREKMGEVEVRRFTYFLPRRWQALAYGAGIGDNLKASALARLQPPSYVFSLARATRALVAEQGVDVVNSHWVVPQGLAAALARGSSPRFGHVATLHGGDSYALGRLPFRRALTRFILGRTDFVFASSSNVRDNLDAALGRASGAVLQPVGVDLERFREPPESLEPSLFPDGHLLFVGRLIPIKGVGILLEALARIRQRRPGLGLVVIGYGPLEADLREQAIRLRLRDAVRFAGRGSPDEIARAMHGCRAVVVPSIVDADGRAEGMPAVVIEAMATGARVVASAAGGIPDVLRPGENGWLSRPGDSSDLAAAVLAALDEPDASAITRLARETADRLAWPAVAARYLEAFEQARAAVASAAAGRRA